MVGREPSKIRHWSDVTTAAFSGLAENFPADECLRQASSGVWGELTPARFPCQKSDTEVACPGWSLSAPAVFAAPSTASGCPCVLGRGMRFGTLIDVADEFLRHGEKVLANLPDRVEVVSVVSSQADFLAVILRWCWLSASSGYIAQQNVSWLEDVIIAELNAGQRQSLRWWSRLCELSGLVQNQNFSIVLRRSLEFMYRKSTLKAIHEVIDGIVVSEQQLIVLAIDGHPLAPSGFHSEKNMWLEAFLSAIDERSLGLCLIAKQPLLDEDSQRSARSRSEYRWRAKHAGDGTHFSLQRVLRRGAWDRLCDALARGEAILNRLA
ncbi:MAG: hypothetical protein RLZZ488_1340 [Pseudomonadota bacterium]